VRPTNPPAIDIERVRVPAERVACRRLEREARNARALFVQQDGAARRRELQSTALLLTEAMAPNAYAAAREAMAAIGIQDRIELYQSGGRGTDTVRLVLYGNPLGIEFIGGYLAQLDHGALLAVLGHEFGHGIAHVTQPEFAWALATSQAASSPSRRAYAMAAEFTADRFGLLACRDIDVALRLEMQVSAGRSASSINLDTDSYLKQCREIAEETLARGSPTFGSTHPEHYIRGYAEWLFGETDLYAAITGKGPGLLSIDEADAMLTRLLGLQENTRLASRATGASLPALPAESTASVGDLDDERVARGLPQTLQELATDILTEGARRKLAATGKVLTSAARAVVPSLKRFSDAVCDQLTPSQKAELAEEDAGDLLDDERRELLARFEELERKAGK
jgi:hypothetical protein